MPLTQLSRKFCWPCPIVLESFHRYEVPSTWFHLSGTYQASLIRTFINLMMAMVIVTFLKRFIYVRYRTDQV